MLFFQPVPVQGFVHPTSFSGIYSEDDYVNDMAQRAAHEYAVAHARVQAFERQRDHCHHHPHHHPHHHQQNHGGLYRERFAPAALDNFCYGFGPASARPVVFSPNRRASVDPFEDLVSAAWEEENRQRALNHRLEAIARQREVARQREAQRPRALAVAAAREQQARAAHAARIQAREARDEELLLTLLGQLGLAVAPAQSAPVAPQVTRQQPPLMFIRPAKRAATPPASVPIPAHCKGKAADRKGKLDAAIAELLAPSPKPAPVQAKLPTFEEELQARLRTETDAEVQESLRLLYSDLFGARKPTQPVAGPSGCKHVSFEIPISGPSSSPSSSPLPVYVKAEGKIDPTSPSTPAAKTRTESTSTEKSDGAPLHRTPALPPAIAAKLLKFHGARRARKLSLAQIQDVEDALRQLEGAFEFPAQLDFVDRSPSPSPSPSPAHEEQEQEQESDGESTLAYTTNNAQVRAYEHALNGLLAKLDAVESNGDSEVRGRRKEVVKEVERALEAMDRRIEESRERSRERASRRRGSVSSQVSDASVTVTPYNVYGPVVASKETPAEVTNNAVEVPAKVEEPEATADVEDTLVNAGDAAFQAEVVESVPAAAQDVPEPNVDTATAEPEFPQLAVGIPDSSADPNAPSPLEQLIDSDPSLPTGIDNIDDVNPALAVSSPPGDGTTPRLVSSAFEEGAVEPVPRHETGPSMMEQEHVSGAESKPTEASQDTSGPVEESNALPTPHDVVVAPGPISPNDQSASTDAATLVTAHPDSSVRDDEVEIITEDEVETARNGSDWSDVGSESCL